MLVMLRLRMTYDSFLFLLFSLTNIQMWIIKAIEFKGIPQNERNNFKIGLLVVSFKLQAFSDYLFGNV